MTDVRRHYYVIDRAVYSIEMTWAGSLIVRMWVKKGGMERLPGLFNQNETLIGNHVLHNSAPFDIQYRTGLIHLYVGLTSVSMHDNGFTDTAAMQIYWLLSLVISTHGIHAIYWHLLSANKTTCDLLIYYFKNDTKLNLASAPFAPPNQTTTLITAYSVHFVS